MSTLLGNLSLTLAVLAAALSAVLATGSVKLQIDGLLRAARWLIGSYFGLLTVSSIALIAALITNDFSVQYVTHYTERALPIGYKLAAFWAGQEGSLLLWAWMLAAMCVIYLFNRRHEQTAEAAVTTATLAMVCAFFGALMLIAANPFTLIDEVPADGHGLNPMLQNIGMIAHPPLLFLGYAGFTIPFAALIGALVTRRSDNIWLTGIRRWTIASWLFLSIGILLGAQWAYVELGWGGYWAWDPVENASLLPWLTGTALLHSIMVQQHRGMLKLWNAGLIAATFALCIFGTYLTRSGVVSSVHSFGESLVGTFFLVFLVVTILLSVVLVAWRRSVLRSEHTLENLLGKEGLFLTTNVLLTVMTIVTLFGTVFPVISRTLTGHEVAVNASFYNKIVAPLGLLLTAIMAVGPLMTYGAEASKKLIRSLPIPFIVGATVTAIFWARGLHNVWALIAVGVVGTALGSIGLDLLKTVVTRAGSHHENHVVAFIRLLDSNHRRYGGQIVHLGMLLIVAGVTGSSLFAQKETFGLKQGAATSFIGQTLTVVKLDQGRRTNYTTVEATVTLTDAAGNVRTFKPERRFYDKAEEPSSEVAIQSDLTKDYYLTLAGWEDGGSVVTIQAIINPLVSWIWLGGAVLTIGGLLCLLPPLLVHPASVPTTPVVPVVKAGRGKKNSKAFRTERLHETV